MKGFTADMLIVGLEELYHERGEYTFKVVLNPRSFSGRADAAVRLVGPTGHDMPIDVRRWGRKLMCTFTIDEAVPNGVGLIQIDAVADDGRKVHEVLSFWTVAAR